MDWWADWRKENGNDKCADSSAVAYDEREYYHHDDYYVYELPPVLSYLVRVIEFNERKKISFASKNGLYPSEIVLLHYCSFGTRPVCVETAKYYGATDFISCKDGPIVVK